MSARIVRKRDLPEYIGLGRTAIEEAIARDDFPRPIKLSKRAVGFDSQELEQWIAKRKAKRDGVKGDD